METEFGCPLILCPSLCNFLRATREDSTLQFADTITFCMVNIHGNHWVLLAVDGRHDQQFVLFLDSLGGNWPSSLHSQVSRLFRESAGWSIRQLSGYSQYDGFECGVWTCWFARLLLELSRRDQAWDLHFLNALLPRAVSNRVRHGNHSDFAQMRQTFLLELRTAELTGTLATPYS